MGDGMSPSAWYQGAWDRFLALPPSSERCDCSAGARAPVGRSPVDPGGHHFTCRSLFPPEVAPDAIPAPTTTTAPGEPGERGEP